MEVVGAAASVFTLIEASLTVSSLCAEYYSHVKNAKKEVDRFHQEVKAFTKVLQDLGKLLAQNPRAARLFASLDEDIKSCSLHLQHLQKKLEPGKNRKAMSRIRALKWPFESKELEKEIGELERYQSTFNVALVTYQISLMLDFDDKMDSARLSKLLYADGASFDSNERLHEPYCLPDTRVDILHQIMKWSADPCQKTIFWLNGMAGTGKSTIARTITHTLKEQKRLAANFFFSRGRGDLSLTGKLFSTVAFQLAATSEPLKHYISEAIAEDENIYHQSMRDQWTKLVYQPLSKLEGDSRSPLILVFDALDECGRQDDVRTLLQLLTEAKNLKNVQLGVLVTSRPEIPISLGFRAISETVHEDFVLHDISADVIRHDISVFLRHELSKIKDERLLPFDWPGEPKLEILVERSSKLFIYAATVCRFIQDPKWLPEKRLDIVLQGNDDAQRPTQRLDEIYIQILRTSVIGDCNEKEKDILAQRFRDTVGSIIVSFTSLSTVVLARLFPALSETISITLNPLKSVLNVPEDRNSPIQLLHPSFRDFLVDPERCLDKHFWINQGKAHHDVFEQCLHVMSKTLQTNICHLRTPGTLKSEIEISTVDQYLPYHVQYACQYWLDHLQKAGISQHDHRHVFEFLQTHFLNWLEALSLIGKMSEAVLMIKSLRAIPELQTQRDLMAFIDDARRFTLEFRYIIETAPLQVYNSALIFSPEASIVKNLFSHELPKWIERLPTVEENWTPSLQALEGHIDPVTWVAFSPDGQLLASASIDSTVRLWDPATGASRGTLEGHSVTVRHVVFSPDGKLLASASADSTVRLWDPATGASRGTLEGHSGMVWQVVVWQVVFSPDGKLLASASADSTVRLWDPATGASRGTLEGHSDTVWQVVFSPDGKLLATASADSTVRLWDPATGASRGTFEGHSDTVLQVTFSPDGKLLASASEDSTVRLWDPATGASRGTLEGHSDTVLQVTFSPDGKLLASASEDSTVRLWDPATGASRGTLEGHSDTVWQVVFSPDGKLLASASEDSTVRLWDPATGASRGTLESHSGRVWQVAFSPDGKLLASASEDSTIRLWDPATEASRGTLESHSGRVWQVAFSPDGKLLASASADSTIRLWDPATGASRGTLEGHSDTVLQVTFSPDGKLLASASADSTVRLWDPATGASRGALEGHSGGVEQVVFSPDGKLLVSASADSTVRLWDPATGASRGTLEGHSGTVSQVVFSPDGKLLASASEDNTVRLWLLASASIDNTVRLWDPATGASRGTLEGHSGTVLQVVLSPDGKLLASASEDNAVRLWDPATGASRGTLEGHSGRVWQVVFSPDGKLLASASADSTVRLWDSATGASRGTLEGHSDTVWAVAFSPDGQFLASGSMDKTTRLWDIKAKISIQQTGYNENLSFATIMRQLEMNETLRKVPSSSLNLASDTQGLADASSFFNVRDEWVRYRDCNVLWLPPNRRQAAYAVYENILALGSASGQVTSFRFSMITSPVFDGPGKICPLNVTSGSGS